MPTVSALIINYNYGRFLRESIESVLSQTFDDLEILIADDGSSDESARIASEYQDDGVIFVSGAHVGLARNLDRGVKAANGGLLAFLSADDRWLPRHVETGVAALRARPDAALSYAFLIPIDECGARIPTTPSVKTAVARTGWVKPVDVLPHNFIYTQTVVLRRDALDAIGGIDPDLAFTELDLFARLVARYPIVHTRLASVEYRVHRGSLNHDYEFTLNSRLAVYEKHFARGESKQKRSLVARAYLKTAYRELADEPTIALATTARRHLFKGILTSPRSVRLHEWLLVPLLLSPRFFVFANDRYRAKLRNSPAKLRLQQILRVAR